ncbi:MAG: hypothetical protein JO208_10415 [Alphaproteobacteria bacterium]|nr:hypothetical protein [Alphaproteobacteria bacterium]
MTITVPPFIPDQIGGICADPASCRFPQSGRFRPEVLHSRGEAFFKQDTVLGLSAAPILLRALFQFRDDRVGDIPHKQLAHDRMLSCDSILS